MATRSRTREFLRLRDDCTSRRPARSALMTDLDSAPLVAQDSGDIQMATADFRLELPPEWVDDVEAVQESMKMIRDKMSSLGALHNKHVSRPEFDGGAEEERAIEISTQEITTIFHKCQKQIKVIGRKGNAAGSDTQKRLTKNIMSSLARDLQSMSTTFRQSQSTYLKKMKAREDRERGHFDDNLDLLSDGSAMDDFDQGFSDLQQSRLKSNSELISKREEEITHIVRSIAELSDIFKDLAVLIVDQGTILDRIDYNVESAAHHVEEGHKELVQANKYQKKATKKMIIILLALIVVSFIFVLIFNGRRKQK